MRTAINKTKRDNTKHLLVMDDHPLFMEGIVGLSAGEPDLTVCYNAHDVTDAMKFMLTNEPDLAIVNPSMAGYGNGLKFIRSFKSGYCQIPMLILSAHDEFSYAQRALNAGAMGYIPKTSNKEEFLLAVRTVLDGKIYLSERVNQKILSRMVGPIRDCPEESVHKLSDRELEILRLIGSGNIPRHIANKMNLSVKTIETHRANIRRKLGLQNANDLLKFAIRWLMAELSC